MRMSAKYTGTIEEITALNAFISLVRAAETVMSRVHRRSPVETDARLTVGQFGVLDALFHLGPLCQRDLAKKILRSGGNMTMIIDNLERRCLVRRERNPEDRRAFRIVLSSAGAELVRRILPEHVRIISEELQLLTADEQQKLRRLCLKLFVAKEAHAPDDRNDLKTRKKRIPKEKDS